MGWEFEGRYKQHRDREGDREATQGVEEGISNVNQIFCCNCTKKLVETANFRLGLRIRILCTPCPLRTNWELTGHPTEGAKAEQNNCLEWLSYQIDILESVKFLLWFISWISFFTKPRELSACFRIGWNYETTPGLHTAVSFPSKDAFHYTRLLKASSNLFLNTSRCG